MLTNYVLNACMHEKCLIMGSVNQYICINTPLNQMSYVKEAASEQFSLERYIELVYNTFF